MLPRVASTTGTLQPSLAPQGNAPVDAARPQLSAAALANLRAELLLRLIETMLRHIPRGPEGAAGRDLLESLFTALKSMPARDGENGKRLSDLIARLPAELRPAADKLIATALSALPTRSLAVILRNPDAPEVHRLATLLAASLAATEEGKALPPAVKQPQRFAGLTVQQLAAVNRHGGEQTAQPADSDARALQTALRRIFDPDGARTQLLPDRAAAEPDGGDQPLQRANAPATERANTRLPAETPVRPAGGSQSEATAQASRVGRTEDGGQPRSAEVAQTRGGETAQVRTVPNVMQAVTGKASPEVLMQALVRLVENLTEEEVQVLRVLLERPLDPAADPARTVRGPALLLPDDAASETTAAIVRGEDDGAEPAQAGPVRREKESAQPAPARPAIVAEEPRMPVARMPAEAAQAAALAEAATTAAPLPLREGVPLAFVPYLTTEDDLDLSETEEVQEEDAAGEDENDGSDAEDRDEPEAEADEPEAADMAERRRKTDDLVDARDADLVFPVRPGDYWT